MGRRMLAVSFIIRIVVANRKGTMLFWDPSQW